jgi:hypothetical protein
MGRNKLTRIGPMGPRRTGYIGQSRRTGMQKTPRVAALNSSPDNARKPVVTEEIDIAGRRCRRNAVAHSCPALTLHAGRSEGPIVLTNVSNHDIITPLHRESLEPNEYDHDRVQHGTTRFAGQNPPRLDTGTRLRRLAQ